MADPLSLTASIIGILGATLHGSKRLFEFIDGLQSAPKEIETLSVDLKAFYETLAELSGMQQKLIDNNTLCDSLKAPLSNCLDIFDEFMKMLQSHTQTSGDGIRKVRTWKRLVWAFKDKEIQLFRDTVMTYKASLNLAVGAVTMMTTTSIDERTERMESDFKQEFKQIQSKLEALNIDRIELASIAGDKGSEWHGTNAHFALNRFLEYTGSLCGSPPASFPGSPVLSPNTECDFDTSKETVFSMADSKEDTQRKPSRFGGPSYYSKSGFDIFRALSLVTNRDNPQINVGAIDLACAIVVCDATLNDCPAIYVSDSVQLLTGYSRHEILGRNCRFLQAPHGKVQPSSKREFVDDGAVYRLMLMIQGRREVQQSIINYRKGGKPFLNLLTIIPIPWDTTEIRYFVGFLTDLVDSPDTLIGGQVNYNHSDLGQYIWTPPSAINQEPESGQTLGVDDVSSLLRQFNPKLLGSDWHRQTWDKMLLENTDDVIHVLSLKGIFLYVSPASKRVLEYDAEELVGQSLSAVCHPSDLVPVTRELKDITPEISISIIFRIRRKHSGYMWFESNGSVFVEHGKDRKSIVLVGRKRPVFTLSRRSMEANGGIGNIEIWAKLSTSGLFLFVSSNSRLLLDLVPESLVGTSIQNLMREESRLEFGRSIEKARRGQTVTCRHEVRHRRGMNLIAETTLYPGDATEGEKPSFLLAQTKLIKAGESTKPTSSGLQEAGKASQLAGGSTALGGHDSASDEVFDELSTTKCSSWQFEVRQMEKANRILAGELQSLLKRKKSTGKRKAVQDCANCHTRTTPEWRRGPSGQKDLCNSCGLRWAKQVGR